MDARLGGIEPVGLPQIVVAQLDPGVQVLDAQGEAPVQRFELLGIDPPLAADLIADGREVLERRLAEDGDLAVAGAAVHIERLLAESLDVEGSRLRQCRPCSEDRGENRGRGDPR